MRKLCRTQATPTHDLSSAEKTHNCLIPWNRTYGPLMRVDARLHLDAIRGMSSAKGEVQHQPVNLNTIIHDACTAPSFVPAFTQLSIISQLAEEFLSDPGPILVG